MEFVRSQNCYSFSFFVRFLTDRSFSKIVLSLKKKILFLKVRSKQSFVQYKTIVLFSNLLKICSFIKKGSFFHLHSNDLKLVFLSFFLKKLLFFISQFFYIIQAVLQSFLFIFMNATIVHVRSK